MWTTRRLHRLILGYAVAGMLLAGAVVAGVGVWPLHARLRRGEERALLATVQARAFAVEEFLARVRDVALQITSPRQARESLEAYNRGAMTREALGAACRPSLEDALGRSADVVGMARLDQRGGLAVQVGQPIPPDCLRAPGREGSDVEVEGPVTCGRERGLVLRAPILAADATRAGTDLVLFRLAPLQRLLADRGALGPAGHVLLGLARRDRAELFFPESPGGGTMVSVDSPLGQALTKARGGETGLVADDAAGGRRDVLAYAPVPGVEWGLVVRADLADVYAAENRRLALLAGTVLVLILLGVLGLTALLRPLTTRAAAHARALERQVREQTAVLEGELAERRRAEEALGRETNLLRALMDNMPDSIYVKDTESRFLLNNAAHVRILGANSQEEVVGKTDFEFFPRELAERYHADERRVLQSGEALLNQEEPVVGPAGRPRWVLTSKVPLHDARGQVVGLVGISRDITESKQAAEELARSNRELEQFASVASHDLQEPLRMVSSYVQLLAQRTQGKLDRDADEFIRHAADGAARMQQLISDLLLYSRVGRQGEEQRPIAAETALAQALHHLEAAIAESGATVTHDPLPTVVAGEAQLVQLFQNLVGNALKFRRAEPPRVHIGVVPQGAEYQFSVRDNGIGIEPQYRDRVFRLFQRLHAREAYPGTGIGLAVCQRIVERHGGRIWVESEPGQGSTFFFTLPAPEGKSP